MSLALCLSVVSGATALMSLMCKGEAAKKARTYEFEIMQWEDEEFKNLNADSLDFEVHDERDDMGFHRPLPVISNCICLPLIS